MKKNSSHRPSRTLQVAATAMTTAAGLVIVALMLLTSTDVILRKFAGEGLRGTVEITEILLVAAVFLGLTGAEVTRTHLRTPLVVDRLPARVASSLTAAGLIVAALCTAWATWASAASALTAYQVHEIRYGLLGLPLWPAKATVPLGMLGFTVALIFHAASAARAARAGLRVSDGRENVL